MIEWVVSFAVNAMFGIAPALVTYSVMLVGGMNLEDRFRIHAWKNRFNEADTRPTVNGQAL